MTSILAICSGKGGVGKSTIAFNLAKLCAESNYKVGLIDADIYGPSLHLLFDNIGDLKPQVVEGYIIPPCINNVHFMSSAFYTPGGAFIRAPKATGILKSFFENVKWPDLDLLIVDFPPGTGDISLSLFQEVVFDGAVVVTTPHTLSVEDAAKSCKMIIEAGIPLIGVVENMSYIEANGQRMFPFGKAGGEELALLFNTEQISTFSLIDQESQSFFESQKGQLLKLKKVVDKSVLNKILCTK